MISGFFNTLPTIASSLFTFDVLIALLIGVVGGMVIGALPGLSATINVNPGDIILADPDGVIAIPRNDAATVLEDAKKFQAADEKKLAAAKNGTANREWVEKLLAEKGYEIIDGVCPH